MPEKYLAPKTVWLVKIADTTAALKLQAILANKYPAEVVLFSKGLLREAHRKIDSRDILFEFPNQGNPAEFIKKQLSIDPDSTTEIPAFTDENTKSYFFETKIPGLWIRQSFNKVEETTTYAIVGARHLPTDEDST